MKRLLTLFVFLSIFLTVSVSFAQSEATPKTAATNGNAAAINITASTPPEELARVAFMAQGGEKFRKVQSMVLRGSVDLFAPNSTQSIPGGFVIVTSGDKVRIEIDARPAVSFKQIYDGQNSYSSLPGVELPPPSKFGLGILIKFDQPGYKITAIPDRKKLRGFRISDMDGNATEFFIDSTTGRVMTFLIGYNGYTFGTEHKKFKEFDGILVPTSFTQRLEMPQGAFFADYNVKDVKLNQTLGEDVFLIPN
jgi:hypothetical protein